MNDGFLAEDFVLHFQVVDDFFVDTVNELALPLRFGKVAVVVHGFYEGQVVSAACLIVVFPEGRRRVHDARAVFRGDVIGEDHDKGVAVHVNLIDELFVAATF